jgi:hypothetical protein
MAMSSLLSPMKEKIGSGISERFYPKFFDKSYQINLSEDK